MKCLQYFECAALKALKILLDIYRRDTVLTVVLFPSYYLHLSTSGRLSDVEWVGQPNYPSVPTGSGLDLTPGLMLRALCLGDFTACRLGSISQSGAQALACSDPKRKIIIKIRLILSRVFFLLLLSTTALQSLILSLKPQVLQ